MYSIFTFHLLCNMPCFHQKGRGSSLAPHKIKKTMISFSLYMNALLCFVCNISHCVIFHILEQNKWNTLFFVPFAALNAIVNVPLCSCWRGLWFSHDIPKQSFSMFVLFCFHKQVIMTIFFLTIGIFFTMLTFCYN